MPEPHHLAVELDQVVEAAPASAYSLNAMRRGSFASMKSQSSGTRLTSSWSLPSLKLVRGDEDEWPWHNRLLAFGIGWILRLGAVTEVAVVQVHPDADSMEFHMKVVRERATRAYAETLEATTSIQVFGPPSAAVLSMLRQQAGAGIPLSNKAHHLGGFTRAT